MPAENVKEDGISTGYRAEQMEKDWVEELYLLRRQRKAILENCRRIAVAGASNDPDNTGFVALKALLAKGLEIFPICPGRESLLGLRCYPRLSDVPGKIDILQVFPSAAVDDWVELAKEAVEKQVATFWIEPGLVASPEMKNILSSGKVQLVEYEELMTEYLKHNPFLTGLPRSLHKDKRGPRVKERMSKNPATTQPKDGLKDAMWKMEHGHFRHLPVVDEKNKLIGMLTDRDVRLIRPSLAFTNKEDAEVQLWSLSVQQAAVFDPISVKPETTLKEAVGLMLRWHVGGLPVIDNQGTVVGVITYTDILREFVGPEEPQ
jgi:acetoin utilization protein AcuB